jgi:hypothetical protein
MKTLTVLFGAAAGVAATISVGAGVAVAAPDVVGQTYSDAKNTLQSQGAAIVIATRTGGSMDLDKCIVTNASVRPSVPKQRQAPEADEVLVALNCNAAVASAGSAGPSAASPEGRKALIAQEAG